MIERPIAVVCAIFLAKATRWTAGFAVGLMVCASLAAAQEYPARTVRMVVPFAPGGGTDVNVRRLSDRLNMLWQQPVVVENMGGGGGNLAASTIATRPGDGYTLFFTSLNVVALNPVLYTKLTYDADRDFAPVILFSDTPHVLMVSAAYPAAKVSELIALAKAQPGALHFGSGGHGTSQHLAGERLKVRAGIDIGHVPYKGSGQAVPAMIGNEIQFIFESISTAIGYIRGGRLRGLAVASPTRAVVLPDLPTLEESGFPGFYSGVSAGILVRTGTPTPIVTTINRSVNAVLNDSDYKKQMADLGVNLIGGTPEQLSLYIAAERKALVPLIQKLDIRLN